MTQRSLLGLIVVAVALAACGPYYSHGVPPGFGTDCIPPTGAVLVYPAPNATNVPDNTNAIYIALPSPLPNAGAYDVALTGPPSYGTVLENGFVSVSASAVPTPNATPTYASPQYYESTLRSTLTAASAFAVYWNQANSACNTGTSASFLGSFTTQ